MKINKIFQIFSFLLLLFKPFSSFCGNTCAPLPFAPDSFLENSAYGFIKYSMYGEGWNNRDYCQEDESKISFAMWAYASGPSIKLTFAENQSLTLAQLGGSNPNPALGGNIYLKDIVLTAKKQGNLLCIFMPTPRGPMPLICRDTSTSAPPPPPETCQNIGEACYKNASRSQSLFNFSGLAVDCLKETLDKVFYKKSNCIPDSENLALATLNSFPQFQESLKVTIRVALILYVMFFGVNLMLNKDYANTNKIVGFLLKFLFVLYFSVGLGPVYYQNGKITQENGMVKYALPFLTSMAPEFAQKIFNSGGNKGLCTFDTSRYKRGYEFYALWDAIDCRIGYYLGMDLLYNIDNGGVLSSMQYDGSSGGGGANIGPFNPTGEAPKALGKTGALKFFTVMFGFLMAGNIIAVASGLIFCLIFLSIMLYFITHYLVCIITIYVMAYVSPIFIPMALFSRTKAYFDSWLKICFSCALQPAVVAGFIALLVGMYDSAIFKTCEFKRHDYSKGEINISTFEIEVPNSDSGNDTKGCKSSAGYKLLQYYAGEGWERFTIILIEIISIRFDNVLLLVELLYVLVFSIIFYYFSKSIGQFAADVTSGPIMDSVTASPTKLVDLAQKAAAFAKDAAQTANGKPPGSGGGGGKSEGASDGASSGGGGASDAGSSGGGGAADMFSSGGGK